MCLCGSLYKCGSVERHWHLFRSLLVSGCRWKLQRLEDKAWERCGDLYFSEAANSQVSAFGGRLESGGKGKCGGRARSTGSGYRGIA